MKRTLRHRSERGHSFTRGETWEVALGDDDVNSGTAQDPLSALPYSAVFPSGMNT